MTHKEQSQMTQILRDQFPRWMAIRNNDDSVGAQFLEVFGLELEKIEDYLSYFLRSKFIDQVDLDEINLIYKTFVHKDVLNDTPLTVSDENFVPLKEETRLQHFYQSEEDCYIVDKGRSTIYFRKYHDKVHINEIPYTLEKHHVWNVFDEFGMLLGLYRIPGESNKDFKHRILDVFKRPPGDSKEGLQNHLSRVLDIDSDEIQVMSLNRLAEKEIDIHGNVSPRFQSYIEKLNKVIPFTWGTMRWDESYWNMFEKIGIDYLPHIYNPDTSMWRQEDFQSGIGDGDDLEIIPPEIESAKQSFNYKVGLKGIVDRSEDIFVEHELKFKVYAEGQIADFDKPPKKLYHTVVASEEVPFDYEIYGYKLYNRTFKEMLSPEYEKENIDLVPGNKIMSANNKFLKIRARLDTDDENKTPAVHTIKVNWFDTDGERHTLVFTSAEDFTRNDDQVVTDLNTVEARLDGSIQLGRGNYSRHYDTVNAWGEGIKKNTKATRHGLSLILPA